MITIFDLIIFTILAISSLNGLCKGLIHIIIHLIGLVASIICAIFLYPYIDILVEKYVQNHILASALGGGVSYFLSFLLFTYVSSIIVRFLRVISKGFFDRLAGSILGFIKGLIIAMSIFSVAAVFSSGTYSEAKNPQEMVHKLDQKKYPIWLKEAFTTPYLENILKISVSYIPQNWFGYPNSPEKENINGNKTVQMHRNINMVKNKIQRLPGARLLSVKKFFKNNYW